MKHSPRLLLAGSAADPLVVVRSATWGFNAIGVFSGDAACVVDPGLSQEEIAMLDEAVRSREGAGPARTVTHVVLTHSHHDHIRGWAHFPGAEITFPRAAAMKEEDARSRIVAAKRKFDERLGEADNGFDYPTATTIFDERLRFEVGALELEQRFLPGHSNCTSVVWIPALHTLLTADYLVTPGMPYCRWRATEFEQAIETLTRWTQEEDVRRVIPAHNRVLEGAEEILAGLEQERSYMQALRGEVCAALGEGLSEERGTRRAARHMVERRGSDLGGRRQDIDNARRVWTEEVSG